MENLNSLLGPLAQETQPVAFLEAYIPYDCINVLAQPRKVFVNIRGLADNIVHEGGLIYPLLVNWYQPGADKKVREHLAHVNFIYNSRHRIKDLIVFRGFRIILIAGERRLRAYRLIWEEGCSLCLEEYGSEPPGTCYKRHFGSNRIRVNLYQKSPEDAVSMQTSENQHVELLPHELAEELGHRLRAKRRFEDPKYPIARFAREVGRDVSTVREAIHYFTQPEETRDLVARGFLSYAIGKLLGKFYSRVGSTQEGRNIYNSLILNALGSSYLARDFEKIVSNRIFCLENGTPALDDIFNESVDREALRRHVRHIVAQNMIAVLSSNEQYFRKANRMFDEGLLGLENSSYSELSVLRRLDRLVEELKITNAHLKRLLLAPRKVPKYEKVINMTQKFTKLLLRQIEEPSG